VQAINAPSVRAGQEILRIAPSAAHDGDDVRRFVGALDQIWSELDVPRSPLPRRAEPVAVDRSRAA
jgi:5-aminolevulinate synthase